MNTNIGDYFQKVQQPPIAPKSPKKSRFSGTKKAIKRNFSWLRSHRLFAASVAVLMLVTAILPVGLSVLQQRKYLLSSETQKVLAAENLKLAKQLVYDESSQAYIFNKDNMPYDVAGSNADKKLADQVSAIRLLKKQYAAVNTAKVGGNSDEQLYSSSFSKDFTKGSTYYDNEAGLSFSLVPKFKAFAGDLNGNRLVYPLSESGLNGQAVYTLDGVGVKEDVVLHKYSGDIVTLEYKLQMADTLQAELLPNGDIGIYSADRSLFVDHSTTEMSNAEQVLAAQKTADKTQLVFQIPAPIVNDKDGISKTATSKFELTGDTLSIVTTNLQNAQYPLSIDPTVVVSSSTSFTSGENESAGIVTAGSVQRTQTSGGELGEWKQGSGYSFARRYAAAAAYNGYAYIMGGYNGAATNLNSYMPIGSDGNLQTAASATNLPGNRMFFQAVPYNNNMYILGGYSGSAILGDVQYTSINSNGSLGGSWTVASPAVPMGNRQSFQAAAYNGFMYVWGGTSTGTTGASPASVLNTVLYAAINADGTLGNWTSTSSMITSRANFGGFQSGGYLYALTGWGGSANTTTVEYAPIKNDGSVGVWTSTTAVGTGLRATVAVSAGGYAFLLAGFAASQVNTVQYAPINANGTLGNWSTMTNGFMVSGSAAPRFGHSGFAYGNVVYLLAGFDNTTNYQTSHYATIQPAGATSSYTTNATPFTGQRSNHQTVAYNGYMYVLGGLNAAGGSSTTATVYYAPINANGSVSSGSWSTGTVLPSARSDFQAVVFNGYMYILGGYTGSGNLNTVHRATIDPSTGALGSWTSDASFTNARRAFSAVVYGSSLYLLGGYDGSTYYSDVQRATINSSTGALTWVTPNLQPSFTTGRSGGGAVTANGYMYVMGGLNGGTYLDDIQYAKIKSDGNLDTWVNATGATTKIPSISAGISPVVFKGNVYITSGASGPYRNQAWYAPLNADGSLGAWVELPTYTTNRSDQQMVTYNGYLYMTGGRTGASTALNDIQYANINNGGNGAVNWTATTSLATGVSSAASVIVNGYIYKITGSGTSTYNYAPIKPNGSIDPGTWSANQSFPIALTGASAVVNNGYIYVLGGGAGNVYYAKPNTNGSISGWTAGTSLSSSIASGSAVVSNNYLYMTGGLVGGTTVQDKVYFTIINADGSLNAWVEANNKLPAARYDGSAIVLNGYVYYVGGYNSTSQSSVFYSQLGPDGAPGIWLTSAAPLPIARNGAIGLGLNGTLYIIGGSNSNTTYMATLGAGGDLESWQLAAGKLPTSLTSAAGAYANGYLYSLGGSSGSTVYYSPVNAITRAAQYSKLVDLGTTANTRVVAGLGNNVTGMSVRYSTSLAANTAFSTPAPASQNIYDGLAGTWKDNPSFLTTQLSDTAAAVVNNYVYVMGGTNGGFQNTVYYAKLNGDGRTSSWQSIVGGLGQARKGSTAASVNGYLYILGGVNASNQYMDSVMYIKPNPDGTFPDSNWINAAPLQTATEAAATTVLNGYIYYIGGSVYGARNNTVQYAKINSDGSLAAWQTTGPLTQSRSGSAAISANGYVYVIAGYTSSGSGGSQASTYYAKQNNDGTLGGWSTSSMLLPQALNGVNAVVANGFVYLVGGITDQLEYSGATYYAKLNNDGTISEWTTANSLQVGRHSGSMAVANNYIYYFGGTYAPTSYGTGVYYARLLPILGDPTAAVRYVRVMVTIDDMTVNGRYGDDMYGQLTSILVDYRMIAPTDMRLRGGKFFIDGALQPLVQPGSSRE